MTFARDTAVTAVSGGSETSADPQVEAPRLSATSRVFDAEIHPGWDVAGNANGGYLMAIAARAMAAVSRPQPMALTAHFLTPGRPGPIRIEPHVLRQGRRFSTVRASVSAANGDQAQGSSEQKPSKPLLELLGSFRDPATVDQQTRVEAQPPELPEPDQCVRIEGSDQGFPPAIMARVDLRLHPEDAAFAAGKPSGRPEFRGWLRLVDDEPMDPFGLLLAVDVFPPTIFNANLPIAWTPTLELTAHVRSQPAPGWLRCRFSTRFITGGLLEEDGEVWDERGRLVAQSRQLALLPRQRD